MMACGCNISAGQPFSREASQRHYEHTMQSMVLWELLMRPGTGQVSLNTELAEKRIAYLEELSKAFNLGE